MHEPPLDDTVRTRFLHRLTAFARWIAEREELPQTEAGTSVRRSERGMFGWFAATNSLPNRADLAIQGRKFLSWLVSRDQLPSRPASAHRRAGFFSWLASGDDLPTNSSDITPKPRFFLRWLLTSDPHERLENHPPTKEVPLHEP